ncbi:MAG: hypothetical protein ACLP7P_06890 [Rhodomicrobium sp.]
MAYFTECTGEKPRRTPAPRARLTWSIDLAEKIRLFAERCSMGKSVLYQIASAPLEVYVILSGARMRTASLFALIILSVVHIGTAKAERINLSCQGQAGIKQINLEINDGNVKMDGILQSNVVNLTVNSYYISFYVDNISSGGYLESYSIDLHTNVLNWTFRRFNFEDSGMAVCERT